MTLVDPGDEVIIPAPFWVTYPEQVKLAQGVPVIVSAGAGTEFRVSVEMLEKARTDKTKVLVFCSPANPTGSVYPADEVDAIARWAVANDVWIVTDEIYHKLVYGDAVFTSVPKNVPEIAERVVITSGVAKSYAMTGWRIGWSVGPEEFTKGVAKLQSQLTSNIGNISQLAAVEALTGPQDEIENMRQVFDRRRTLALKALREINGVDVVEPQGAFYVFPSFAGVLGKTLNGHHITSTLQLAELLLDEVKVAIVPGEAFGAPGYLRLSYALGEDDLVEGIGRIADFVNNG
jgi:aspartate/methionine/tyrosine aminotransferase